MANPNESFVHVQIITTSGTYPSHGYDRVPTHQKVRIQLNEAARKLELTDTSGWVLSLGGREIDPEKSWLGNGLHGDVQLDWGPREGGGGAL